MTLTAGARLGGYQITGALGAGGMGEVYRARDTKLHRDVALKIVPDAVASDPERIARFQREAQVLAALNHPNIAQIYGFDDTGPTHALVMELVDGETLADRIARGPIALADTLPIAMQIAQALEAAHEQAIVHRDLKPANVKVRDDGTVKVLDFGLAKALAGQIPDARADAVNSPTLTSPAATALGVILGTAAYMSPEQAKGRPVDKRADIWAFGVVMFEMLTGRTLFAGDSVVETVGLVATKDPDWSSLPESTPAGVRRLLARCLTRDPKHRLRDIGEARIALAAVSDEPVPAPRADASRPARRGYARGTAAAVAVAAVGFVSGWYLGSRRHAAPQGSQAHLQVEIVPTPPDAFARFASQRLFTFTPDGQALIYASTDPDARLLYRRVLAESIAVPIAGTEGAYGPFVSPDSAWIGFFADGKLKRVPGGGGAAQTIHDMRSPSAPDAIGLGWSSELGPAREIGFGATFLGNDVVYGRFFGGLWRIPVTGGLPTPLTMLAPEGEIAHRLPQALPGGRAILFTAIRGILATQGSSVDAWDLGSGTRVTVVPDATDARYAPGGYLLFVRNAALYSIAFDPASLQTSGDPVRLSGSVRHAIGGGAPGRASGAAQFDVSADGIVAALPGGGSTVPDRPLVWASRGGRIEPVTSDASSFLAPRLSPDGSRIAAMSATALAIIGIRDGIATPLTRDATFPVWLPDGSRVVAARRGANVRQDIYSYSLSGGAPQAVVSSQHTLWPSSVSTDGKYLAYVESNPKTGNDIWVVDLAPNGTAAAIVSSPANETHPAFSPDGRWLVYVVEEEDATGLYVRPFPGPGRAERVTRDVASAPIWLDDRTILYAAPEPDAGPSMRRLVRLTIDTTGNRIAIGPAEVFATAAFGLSTPVGGFDVAADGRVLIPVMPSRPTDAHTAPTLQLTVPANRSGGARK